MKGNDTALRPISCDQCEMVSINGIPCHETGCVHNGTSVNRFTPSIWNEPHGVWIKQRRCFECGCTIDADEECCTAS